VSTRRGNKKRTGREIENAIMDERMRRLLISMHHTLRDGALVASFNASRVTKV
jgi:hypothetical protein